MSISPKRTSEEQKAEFLDVVINRILKIHSDTLDDSGIDDFLEQYFDDFYINWVANEETQKHFDLIDLHDEAIIDQAIEAVEEMYKQAQLD